MGIAIIVHLVTDATILLPAGLVMIAEVAKFVIKLAQVPVQVVIVVTVAMTAQEAVLVVMQNAIIAMMYIVGAVGLLVVVEAVELELEIVNNMPNYLNNIVNYKFDNQCIYCIQHKHHNLYSLHNHDNYYNTHICSHNHRYIHYDNQKYLNKKQYLYRCHNL